MRPWQVVEESLCLAWCWACLVATAALMLLALRVLVREAVAVPRGLV